jgi:hypothetical protein
MMDTVEVEYSREASEAEVEYSPVEEELPRAQEVVRDYPRAVAYSAVRPAILRAASPPVPQAIRTSVAASPPVAQAIWTSVTASPSVPQAIRTSVTASRVHSTSETPEAKALRALAEAGYANLSIQDLSRLLPPDSREKELIVMADVRAYFHVAYKVSLAYIPCFNVFIASSSASLTIFL